MTAASLLSNSPFGRTINFFSSAAGSITCAFAALAGFTGAAFAAGFAVAFPLVFATGFAVVFGAVLFCAAAAGLLLFAAMVGAVKNIDVSMIAATIADNERM